MSSQPRCCKRSSSKKCPHDKCGKRFDIASYFIQMPLKDQLQTLFGQGFYDNLKHHFEGQVPSSSYEGIEDKELYQSHCQNGGFLSKRTTLSFTFNTDGAAVFKGSKVSVCPLFLLIKLMNFPIRKE